MPNLKSEKIDKIYFKTKEVSRITGLAQSAIRYYEDEFFLEIKKGKRLRQFTEIDIKKFEWIALASAVYKLHIVKLALMRFPESRFMNKELLTTQEQIEILQYDKNNMATAGR